MKSLTNKISRRGFTKLLVSVPLGAVILDGLSVLGAQPQVARPATSDAKSSGLGTACWKITYQAHYGGNSWAAPVAISYVTGYTGGGSWRRKVGLRNVSARSVRSIVLGAHIINQDKPSVIIATTALPAIQFKDGLARGAALDVDAKDDLETIFRPFVKNGVLEGDYRIELFVREVVNDVTTWRYDSKPK
jgi:hypothetical protein